MSKYEQPIKEWNAVTYLRDFISTCLILTLREQAVWDYLQKENKAYNNYFYQKPQRGNIAKKYRTCMRCGEIKTIQEFETEKSHICLECRQAERFICKT